MWRRGRPVERPDSRRFLRWATRAIAIAAVVGGTAVGAAPASAFMVEVRNDTGNDVQFEPAHGQDCWDSGNKDFPTMKSLYDKPVIPPRSVGKFEGGGPSFSIGDGCRFRNSYRQMAIKFRGPNGSFQEPMDTADAYPFGAPQLAYRSGKAGFENSFYRWIPTNPAQEGTKVGQGAGGGFCITDTGTKTVASDRQAVFFTLTDDLGRCNNASIGRVLSSAPASTITGADSDAEPRRAVDPKSTIVSMLDLGTVLCQKIAPALSWERNCGDIPNQQKWNLQRLTADVKKWEPQNKVQPNIGWKQVGDGLIYRNPTDEPKEIPVSLAVTTGTRSEKNHCDGFKFGEKFEVSVTGKIKFPLVGETDTSVTVGFDAEQNWSDCKISETNSQTQQTITFPVKAKPNGVTTFRFLQGSADMKLNYTADLTVGQKDTAEAFRTPLARGLSLSSARVLPCVGTLVGATDKPDPFSMLGIGKQMQSFGYSADSFKEFDPNLRNTLAALPKFQPASGDRCPGWPAAYPGAMAFRGEAGISVNTQGAGAEDAPWAPGIGTIKPVEDFQRFAGSGSAAARSGLAARADTSGDDGEDVITADGPGQTLAGAGGTDVLEGAAGPQELFGGGALDVLTAAGGDDTLDGGPGSDSLYGEDGDDTLDDAAGMNRLDGGDGQDVLRTTGRAIGGLSGGSGADRLVLDGDGPVSLDGGEGDDTYVLERGAKAPRVTEFPGAGRDTILASGDVEVPPAVERVEALGADRVSVSAGDGEQTIAGGPESDELSGGPGADRLNGRGGDDRIPLEEWGFDRATGGPGADAFTPIAMPLQGAIFDRSELGIAPTAHEITDLDPSEGDRLVLRTVSFGRRIEQLDRRMIVRQGQSPRPRGNSPQLLFDTGSALLSFDRDGAARAPAQVVAVLEGHDRVPVDAISVPAGAP